MLPVGEKCVWWRQRRRMKLLSRTTRLDDLGQCAAMLRDRFLYDDVALRDLQAMWRRIIVEDVGRSAVVFEDGSPKRILAFGVSAAVSDDYYDRIPTEHAPFVGKKLLDAWRSGNNPLLDESAFGLANAGSGVNFVVIHNGLVETRDRDLFTSMLSLMSEGFVIQHAGCNVRATMNEAFGIPRGFSRLLGWSSNSYSDDQKRQLTMVPPSLEPEIVSVNRREAERLSGNLVLHQLFLRFTPPQCRLSAEERRMLRYAVEGESDDSIAEIMQIAPRTLKSRWASIYTSMEHMIGIAAGGQDGRRGVEVRRHILRYIREHREELCAYGLPHTRSPH